ncbi:MAG TPA: hypothetical protein VNG33_16020 [Polyangiaceae bacterium]|nr:hypothetical protein [Polyangiaceae bacterium]
MTGTRTGLQYAGPRSKIDEWLCPTPTRLATIDGVQEVVAGHAHICVRGRSGEVRCLGRNPEGALGDGTLQDRASLADRIARLPPVARLCAGGWHSCAATVDGRVFCWGDNRDGELGDGTTTDRATPVQTRGLDHVVEVACGTSFSCALLQSDEVKCWGLVEDGSGNSPTEPRPLMLPSKSASAIH